MSFLNFFTTFGLSLGLMILLLWLEIVDNE